MLWRALSIIFALLLNTKVDTPEKIKEIIKIAIETTIRNMARTKATVGILHVKTCRLPGLLVSGEYSKKKTVYLFKIKEVIPEEKAVNITKEGKIIKTNIKRKSRYLKGKNNLIFWSQKIL